MSVRPVLAGLAAAALQLRRRAAAATIACHRLGRRVRGVVEVGDCERLLVPLRVVERAVVWRSG